jgi:hypothetical protein
MAVGRIKRGYEPWLDRLDDRIARKVEFRQMVQQAGKREPGTLVSCPSTRSPKRNIITCQLASKFNIGSDGDAKLIFQVPSRYLKCLKIAALHTIMIGLDCETNAAISIILGRCFYASNILKENGYY